MRDLVILFVHLITTLVRLAGPGGVRSVVAESLLAEQQLLILNRSRRRSPNLRVSDRIIAGLCALLIRRARLMRSAIVLKPSTLLHLHHVLAKRKYRMLFSRKRRRPPGPKGPNKELIDAIVEMKQRNPNWGCPRMAQQLALAFGVRLTQTRQHSKKVVLSPAVDREISIQCQYISCPKLVRQTNQARIGKINVTVAVLPQHMLYTSTLSRKLERNLKNPGGNVFDHRFWRTRQVAQQIAGLCDYRFASDQGRLQFSNRPGARPVRTLTTIQEGNDNTGVEQDRLHRPKSLKCFLLDPRSRTRDSNLPRPMMPCFLRRK